MTYLQANTYTYIYIYICIHVCLHVHSENRSIYRGDFLYCPPVVPLKYEDVETVRVGFLK